MIKYVDLRVKEHEIDDYLNEIRKVLLSGQFILGEEVRKFERNISELLNVSYVIGVNSGTDALFLSMKALNIGEGDEVITVSNSFLATSSAIINAGAKPVFVDIGEDKNINTKLIESAITEKTKAIIPVHLYGFPCDMSEVMRIARENDLFVIEDCAQSIMSSIRDKYVGTWGDVGCFSLHPLKNFSAFGDGGIIVTNNKEIYEELSLLRNHGLKNRDECIKIGINSRLDALQASVLNIKIDKLVTIIKERRKNANLYIENLKNLPIILPLEKENEFSVYNTFVIRTANRDSLKDYLKNKGIESKIHYPILIHQQSGFEGKYNISGNLNQTIKQASEILSLPIHNGLSEEDIKYISQSIVEFFKEDNHGFE